MTEAQIEAAAAELDGEATEELDAEPGVDDDIYAGRVVDGPWRGRNVAVRYPKGFLLIEKARDLVWIYDRDPNGEFRIREGQPESLMTTGEKNRWRAADEANYDIRVLDAGVA